MLGAISEPCTPSPSCAWSRKRSVSGIRNKDKPDKQIPYWFGISNELPIYILITSRAAFNNNSCTPIDTRTHELYYCTISRAPQYAIISLIVRNGGKIISGIDAGPQPPKRRKEAKITNFLTSRNAVCGCRGGGNIANPTGENSFF